MKKLFFLGFVLFSSAGLFFACLQSNSDLVGAENLTYTLSHTELDFSLDLSFDENGEVSLSSEEEKVISTYLIRLFGDLNFQSIERISVLTYIDEQAATDNVMVTLAAYGSSEVDTHTPLAVEFGSGTSGLITKGKLEKSMMHHCTGNACNCCDFIQREISDQSIFPGVRATGQKVVGCTCDTSSKDCAIADRHCNHNITSDS